MGLLEDSLFTTTQKNVLGVLYGHPYRSFYIKEIIRITKMGVATIKRELDRMLGAGILTMKKIGNQHHYQANTGCLIYQELLGIVNKTFGVANIIKSTLNHLKENISWAFIFGSVASGKDTLNSDIDLMIIGDIDFGTVVQCLYSTQTTLGREINPKVFTINNWKQLKNNQDSFIKEVLLQPKIDIIVSDHEHG